MILPSHTLARLIEPALYAISQARGDRVSAVLTEARSFTRATRDALKERGVELEPLSFELGVGTAFVEMLATVEQRSILGDAIRKAEETQRGTETLHVIGFLSRSALDATQGELADKLGIDRGNFNRRVRDLESSGLVRSQRMGRKLIYDLTPLGIDVLNHARPGWKALHPETLNLLGSETEAKAVAATIATALQQAIGQEQSEATKLINAVVGRLSERSTQLTSLFEATKSQSRSTFGVSISPQLPQTLVEHRAA